MSEGLIFDLRRYAVHDGPGIRTTVFFKGCPLQCQWCHNPESQAFEPELLPQAKLCIGCGLCRNICPGGIAGGPPDLMSEVSCERCGLCATVCPTGARMRCGERVNAAELMPRILRDRIFYDQSGGGVTFSGGEPLAQAEFLLDLLRRCGREEVHRAVDTSGYAPVHVVEKVAAECELFLYDLKLMDTEKHKYYTGVDNKQILSNLHLLSKMGAEVIIRMPLIPGINDNEEDLRQLAIFVKTLQREYLVQLLPYHRLPEGKYAALGREYSLSTVQPPTKEQLEKAANVLRLEGIRIQMTNDK